MQLDSSKAFSEQIENLKGTKFEHIVAACYLYLGYHVERNINFGINKQQVGEIDVLGLKITPLNEIQVLAECKGRHPSFNDLRKFGAFKSLIKNDHSLIDLIAYGSDSMNNEHEKIANRLDITLVRKSDISKKVLPILWGTGELISERITEINKYLILFEIEDKHIEVKSSIEDSSLKSEFNSYHKYLFTDLWSISDPITQLENSFEHAKDDYHNFATKVAENRGVKISDEVRRPTDKVVQLAIYLELKHRILNTVAISRATISARTKTGREAITERTPVIQSVLNSLCDYNVSPNKFLVFVYRWIFLWGGAFKKQDGSVKQELEILCEEVGVSKRNGEFFLEILKEIYGSGSNLVFENSEILFFKFVPATFRALGLKYREMLGLKYDRLFADDSYNQRMFENLMGEKLDDYPLDIKA
jgi:hypothetical protein